MSKPEHRIQVKRDRTLGGRLVEAEVPSETVKRSNRLATGSAGTILGSFGGGVNKVYGNNEGTQDKAFRVTGFELFSNKQVEFACVDRSGTFRYPSLVAGGRMTLLGAPDEPVFVTRGTFSLRFLGSVTQGTFSFSIEGVVPQFGTETPR